MSNIPSSQIGVYPDDVVLTLNGQTLLIAESWDVHESVLEQPSSWSIRMGSGATAAQILSQYPCRTPFQLSVGGALQATGRIDGRRASGETGGATEIVIHGRDALAPLHDYDVAGLINFKDTTYLNLTWSVLSGIGLVTGDPSNPDPKQLASTNDANRAIKSGKTVTVLQPPRTPDQIIADPDDNNTTVTTQVQITAKPGEKWHTFLRRYLDAAGLVLWAAADGTFVLSVPNVNQQPLYQITRQTLPTSASFSSAGNATAYSFTDDCTQRHSAAVIYGRGGGRKNGVAKTKGSQIDLEMTSLGYAQIRCHHDTHCQSIAQCENFAQRRLAEERREGYQLWYTIPGHTLPCIGSSGGTAASAGNAVISTDTCVLVNDEELGIKNTVYYIDSLIRSRNPYTVTKVRLVRPADIVLTPGTNS